MFTPEFVAGLVDRANAHLRAESQRPKGDARKVRTEIKDVTARRDRLLEMWEQSGGELEAVAVKLKKYEERLAELQSRLREIEGPDEPPPPIPVETVEAVVADLHDLLTEDVASVAPILRELTGPVTVTQEKQEGKRGRCGSPSLASISCP